MFTHTTPPSEYHYSTMLPHKQRSTPRQVTHNGTVQEMLAQFTLHIQNGNTKTETEKDRELVRTLLNENRIGARDIYTEKQVEI